MNERLLEIGTRPVMRKASGMPNAKDREQIDRIRFEKLKMSLTYPVASGIVIFLSWIAGSLMGYLFTSTF